MTALSAVLITVGSIPAIPAISAGAGGAFLASGTAHAIGSIAVGVGSLLKAIGESTGRSMSVIKADLKKEGDLGLVAMVCIIENADLPYV